MDASILLAACGALLPNAPRQSLALPFIPAPLSLDGSLVGDAGFDPLGLATVESLPRLRAAELRHARLAMVATWGWPIAESGFWIAQKLVPVKSVCTGGGCYVDSTEGARQAALQLADIGVISVGYWGLLLAAAIAGELRARSLEGSGQPAFDPLSLWTAADAPEQERLELAEIKHGRLAMVAIAAHWATKLGAACGSAAAAAAAGVPKGTLTFAHQLWSQTCVYSLTKQTTICYPQFTNDQFDFILSWEIMFRVVTGYFREPYF
uniref:Chlorophyll a-b binding protein, chloroplastic n=1 Tax=Coccolithus braarudii TaxID=221442 RepID=A0A7S0L6L5_9EUKA|mmetsp:Transcript_18149/g.38993  ORF Transcript_18149/g.38993 Transcript_18149/m.38993 type:complete len:265 (+) Transcript_18149:12-806(+)|eukprot:CAMPEP_0183358196 /NCGR_PEP_ID=MMETSP0164_2-20130417/48486_1 /TAXON_ID=221442 /ORGANISM="Coccolithus pelagicus ssp braarudi, Strain PLY182g" /LENGTH=264 /DNA_ID=CAMNT_0025532043 /DNA_START=12 /DNA_END=806 /DNA_ORIENTATION=+